MATQFTGKPISIEQREKQLVPVVHIFNVSLEANFGQDPGRPFKFDMDKCPELAFE
jgi:hypothetical protein